MDSKFLSESGLKSLLTKHKLKDNGLLKSLAAYERLGDNEHDACLDEIGRMTKLAAALKKTKEVAAADDVSDYLDNVIDAAGSEAKDVAKAKATSDKNAAADKKKEEDAANKKDDEDEDGNEEDEEEEQGEIGDRLLVALKKVRSLNGKSMAYVLCDARPVAGFMIAKRISSKIRKELTELTGGSKKFLLGECRFENAGYLLIAAQNTPGLARKVSLAVKNYTGKKFKFAHGDETSDDEGGQPGAEETPDAGDAQATAGAAPGDQAAAGQAAGNTDAGATASGSSAATGGGASADPNAAAAAPTGRFAIKGTVGRGGNNATPDVQQVQAALNAKVSAGLKVNGACDPATIAAIVKLQQALGQSQADGLVTPGRGAARALAGSAKIGPPPEPPKPIAPPTLGKAELAKAPQVWENTRKIVDTNIQELTKAVHTHYGSEDPALLKQIDQSLGKLNVVLQKLDTRLTDSLTKAAQTDDAAARAAELKNSKAVLVEYIQYVKSEPLISHIDSNPFGVTTSLKKVLTDSLTHMAQAIS